MSRYFTTAFTSLRLPVVFTCGKYENITFPMVYNVLDLY